ncbi:MAG: DUF6399 domain-containing protein [Deltaproteobacteria bacterium]|nr:DUF6399 domain-containing protein [Deltaproteobacteria bacterium]
MCHNSCHPTKYGMGKVVLCVSARGSTVIHNFGLTRLNGTTASGRLFEIDFPDLFEFVVNQMGDLPIARMDRKS